MLGLELVCIEIFHVHNVQSETCANVSSDIGVPRWYLEFWRGHEFPVDHHARALLGFLFCLRHFELSTTHQSLLVCSIDRFGG